MATIYTAPSLLADPPERLLVLGVRADRVDMTEALARIEALIEQHRYSSEPAFQVITLNPEFVWTARKNTAFRETINQAKLVVADGIGIIWASRILGRPFPERVAGSDLLPLLAERCAARGYRLFLLGAAPGVAEKAADILQKRLPGLQIAGTYAGSPAPEEAEHILELIRTAQPDVLAVAYGAPKQDLWIRQHVSALGEAGVSIALDTARRTGMGISGLCSAAPHLACAFPFPDGYSGLGAALTEQGLSVFKEPIPRQHEASLCHLSHPSKCCLAPLGIPEKSAQSGASQQGR